MALEPGSLLNKRYRIVEVLGQGGMAAVYRAIDENLGVEVAVKENLFTTDEYARQFRLEATILAGLRQPNLPRVSDHFVIEPQGQYLIMDYIEGEDLRQRVDRLGPLPEQEVIIIGVAICDAMAYMHSRKPMVLHRDIKPGNVRITPSGHIFLVDFGLAKLVEGRETTNTGARAMTPGYSPPEQYGTAHTDPRSDIFSLGATLYSALTDVLPEDALDRAMARTDLTTISKHNPMVSEHVAVIIEKCLAIRAEDRFQTAEELRYALMEARSISKRKLPLELVLPSPPATIHEHLPAEAEKLTSDQISSGSWMQGGKKNSSTRPLNQNQENIELVPRRDYSNRRTMRWLLFALLPLLMIGGFSLYTIRPQFLERSVGFIYPYRSPTNTFVLISPPGNTEIPVLAIETKTSTPKKTATITSTFLPTFTYTPEPTATITKTPLPTPLGGAEQIAFASTRSGAVEIWLTNLDGTGLVQITNVPEGACQPTWSPDGRKLVFISPCTRDMNSYPGASLFIINSDGTGLTPLPSAPGGDFDPSWSPDGSQIAFTSLRKGGVPGIFIINLSDYSLKSLVEDEARAIDEPAWSPNGRLIAYVNSDNRIWVMDRDGNNRQDVTLGGGADVIHGPAWSPDSSVIIFTRAAISDTTGYNSLMAVPFIESGATPVDVPNSTLIADISYSFDGYWLLFTSWYSGNHEISIMRPNGVDRHVINPDPSYDFDPAWRPILTSQP